MNVMDDKPVRSSWDEYYIDLAVAAASRSTCSRLSVGAVIVRDKQIISTGYNGSLSGAPHCVDVGCLLVNGHCVATTHAEQNAIQQAAKLGVSTAYGVMYVTHKPCLNCFKAAYTAGIKRIVYKDNYGDVDYSILKLNPNNMIAVVQLPQNTK
jgi:dCMP deaminase